MVTFTVFTDGSSTVYKNKNGLKFGGIGVHIEGYEEYNISKQMAGSNITNQKAELSGCIEAIKICKHIANILNIIEWDIILYSDSMYAIKCATEWAKKWEKDGWKRKSGNKLNEVLNLDLIKELYGLVNATKIKFFHVRSHQKEPSKISPQWKFWMGNKMADELASNAMVKAIKHASN